MVATHTAFDTGEVLRGAHGAFLARLDFGVTLFFVLSGFLLGRPFFAAASGPPPPVDRHYLWKRGLRILPLYWVTVLPPCVLPENRDLGPGHGCANLTLTQIYTEGVLPPGLPRCGACAPRSLFYVLLPACASRCCSPCDGGWAPTRILLGLAVIAAVGSAWQIAAAGSATRFGPQAYHQWLPGFLPWFAVGIAFAVVSAQTRNVAAPRHDGSSRPPRRGPSGLLARRRRRLRARLHAARGPECS